MAFGGGFFGGGEKKNSGNTTNDTKTSVANMDFAGAEGGINSVNLGTTTGSQIDLSIVDGGAIAAMLEATKGSNELARDFTSQIAAQNTRQLQSVESLAQSVTTGGQTVVAETSARMIKYISIGLGVVGIAFVASRIFK